MPSPTLLLDGDIFAYKAAASSEKATNWGDDIWTLHVNEDEAMAWLGINISRVREKLDAGRIVVALSDTRNFRKDVLPTYKSNRATTRKPMLLGFLKEHLRENYEVFERPGLEGDDVIGILATSPKIIKGEKIIVSLDKDMKTIPGKLYNDGKPERGVVDIAEEEADYWHLYQTLTGDATDGYSGCPGIGPKKAEALLNQHGAIWQTVVNAYAGAKLGEEEALTQARVARILRNTDYDFKKKEPILWTPTPQ